MDNSLLNENPDNNVSANSETAVNDTVANAQHGEYKPSTFEYVRGLVCPYYQENRISYRLIWAIFAIFAVVCIYYTIVNWNFNWDSWHELSRYDDGYCYDHERDDDVPAYASSSEFLFNLGVISFITFFLLLKNTAFKVTKECGGLLKRIGNTWGTMLIYLGIISLLATWLCCFHPTFHYGGAGSSNYSVQRFAGLTFSGIVAAIAAYTALAGTWIHCGKFMLYEQEKIKRHWVYITFLIILALSLFVLVHLLYFIGVVFLFILI